MEYLVTRAVLSSDKDLLRTSEGFGWVTEPPTNVPTYDVDFRPRDCVKTSLYLSGKDVDDSKKLEAYTRALRCFPEKLPFGYFVPKDVYRSFVRSITDRLDEHTSKPQYYDTSYVPHTYVFDSLERALVDTSRISYHSSIRSNDVNRPVLATFLPDSDGVCRPVQYDRLSGRTGRLKVASGPSILTLKKEHRDILRSRFPGGKIISVDYKSLEARTFLYSTGGSLDEDDIYEVVAQKVFKSEFPRHIIKAVVISLLYGMGDAALAIKLNIDKAKVRKLSREVKKFFKHDELKERLESELQEDRVANHYGRSIVVPDIRLLLNTFVQSSAVDVVLHGYARMIKEMPKHRCVPLFVLHDALILDVADDCDTSFLCAGETVPGYEGRFPVHITPF